MWFRKTSTRIGLVIFVLTGVVSISGLAQENMPDFSDSGFLTVIAGSSENIVGSPALTFVPNSNSLNVAVDQQGRIYFDQNSQIRRAEADGTISEFAVHDPGYVLSDFKTRDNYLYHLSSYIVWKTDIDTGDTIELPNYVDGNLENAGEYYWNERLAVDSQHNIYVSRASKIYRIDGQTHEVTYFAGNGEIGYSGNDIPATDSPANVRSMVVDPKDDSLLFVGWEGHFISRIDPATGIITDVSGQMPQPIYDIDVHPSGDLLLAAPTRVYRLSPASGQITSVAGNNSGTASGDGGPALSAGVQPWSIAVSNDGDIYFTSWRYTDWDNKIRKVDEAKQIVSTVIGAPGFLSCASATSNLITDAFGIETDDSGIVYIQAQFAILAIDRDLDLFYTVAGVYGTAGSSPDAVPAFGNPIEPYRSNGGAESGFTVAPNGDIYIAESGRLRRVDRETGLLSTIASGNFRKITHDGQQHIYAVREEVDWIDFVKIHHVTGEVSTVVGGGQAMPVIGESAEGRLFGLPDWFSVPDDIAVDGAGNIYLAMNYSSIDFPKGILKIDAQSKVLSAVTDHDPAIGDVAFGGMALDSANGLLYYGGLWIGSYHAGIVRVDLASGSQTRFAARNSGSSSANLPTSYDLDPLSARFTATDLAVDRTGALFVIDRASMQLSQAVLKISSDLPIGNELLPGDIVAGSNAGQSVAQRDNWLAIGVPNGRSGMGEVLMYQNNDCRPILQERLVTPDGLSSSQFGSNLVFAGNNLVVSASEPRPVAADIQSTTEDSSIFQLGVFGLKQGRAWQFDHNLSEFLPPATPGSDPSLVSNGESFAVGSPGANEGQGQVAIFNVAQLGSPTTVRAASQGSSGFGKSIALSDTHLVVGADSSGANGFAEVFQKNAAGYTLKGTVDGAPGHADFAADLALNDVALYVGSPNESGGRVYDYTLANLELFDTLSDPDDSSNASFGETLAIENGILVVGAPETLVSAAARTQASLESGVDTSPIPVPVAGGAIFAFGVKDGSARRTKGNLLFTLLARAATAYGEAVDINNGRIVVGAPQTDDGRGAFEPVGQIVDAAQLSGLWYDAKQDGEGYNLLVAPQGMVLFFYGYDINGERLWLISETVSGDFQFGQDIHVPVYKAVAGDFAQPKSSAEALVEYGVLSMSFGSLRSATFTINGFDGNKISRSTFLADTTANGAAYSGLWFDPDMDGEGFNVISGKYTTVIYYYGSTDDGERLWLISDGMSNELSDGQSITGRMYEAVGGDFFHPEPSSSSLRDWGTIEARFDDCGEGRFILNGNDGNKTSDVIKLAGVAGATCN